MKSAPTGRLVTALVFSAIILTGCNTNQQPEAGPTPTPTDTETDTPSQSPTPSATAETSKYTDPSQADTYCDALDDLLRLSEEAASDDEETTVAQMGTRLDLLVAGTSHIGDLAADEEAAKEWKAVSDGYSEATNLFRSSGGQVANTDFLLLLSEATKTANTTYRNQSDSVEDECGIDITKLIAEEQK